jgi:putative hydrolase of the HAD superfamily
VLPQTLLLDLDDTILDDTGARDRCWEVACDEAAARHGVDRDELLRSIFEVRDWFWADAERHREWRQDMSGAWREVARLALERLGIEDDALAAELGDRNAALREELRELLPGAVETLEILRERGVTLGLITNGAADAQREKLERFALAAHFSYIGIEGEVGHGKPHRRAYEAALEALAAEPATTWMVGDNLEWDVAGAQALGIRGIWLDKHGDGVPPGADVEPDAVVRSIAELLA